MKSLFLFFIIVPFFAFSQSTSKGFEISGNVTGYADGTSVSFLNQQTQTPEKQATIEKGKFTIKGQLAEPSFIILIFADQPPAIPLFIDNSKIVIKGDKSDLDNLSITGSKTEAEYQEYSKAIKPYETHVCSRLRKRSGFSQSGAKDQRRFCKKIPYFLC